MSHTKKKKLSLKENVPDNQKIKIELDCIESNGSKHTEHNYSTNVQLQVTPRCSPNHEKTPEPDPHESLKKSLFERLSQMPPLFKPQPPPPPPPPAPAPDSDDEITFEQFVLKPKCTVFKRLEKEGVKLFKFYCTTCKTELEAKIKSKLKTHLACAKHRRACELPAVEGLNAIQAINRARIYDQFPYIFLNYETNLYYCGLCDKTFENFHHISSHTICLDHQAYEIEAFGERLPVKIKISNFDMTSPEALNMKSVCNFYRKPPESEEEKKAVMDSVKAAFPNENFKVQKRIRVVKDEEGDDQALSSYHFMCQACGIEFKQRHFGSDLLHVVARHVQHSKRHQKMKTEKSAQQ